MPPDLNMAVRNTKQSPSQSSWWSFPLHVYGTNTQKRGRERQRHTTQNVKFPGQTFFAYHKRPTHCPRQTRKFSLSCKTEVSAEYKSLPPLQIDMQILNRTWEPCVTNLDQPRNRRDVALAASSSSDRMDYLGECKTIQSHCHWSQHCCNMDGI